MIDRKMLGELTQCLNDAIVLLDDMNSLTNSVPDLGYENRKEILARVRGTYFREFHNRPIEL